VRLFKRRHYQGRGLVRANDDKKRPFQWPVRDAGEVINAFFAGDKEGIQFFGGDFSLQGFHAVLVFSFLDHLCRPLDRHSWRVMVLDFSRLVSGNFLYVRALAGLAQEDLRFKTGFPGVAFF